MMPEPARDQPPADRSDHLAWAKVCAIRALPDQRRALHTFLECMQDHPETRNHPMLAKAISALLTGTIDRAFFQSFR